MNLKDIVDIGFGSRTILENFIFVASYFEAPLPLIKRTLELAGQCDRANIAASACLPEPFFRRTSETLVSRIWFDGWIKSARCTVFPVLVSDLVYSDRHFDYAII